MQELLNIFWSLSRNSNDCGPFCNDIGEIWDHLLAKGFARANQDSCFHYLRIIRNIMQHYSDNDELRIQIGSDPYYKDFGGYILSDSPIRHRMDFML